MESAQVVPDHDPYMDPVGKAAHTRFEDLPPDNVTFRKRRMLDNLGICLVGSNELQVNVVRG